MSTTVTWRIITVAVAIPRKPSSIFTWRANKRSQRSANTEAISHLTTALDAAHHPAGDAGARPAELTLHLTLGAPLMAAQRCLPHRQWKLPIPAPGRCVCRSGRPASSCRSSMGSGCFTMVRGELRTTLVLGEQFLHLAQREQDPTLLLEALSRSGEHLLLSWRVCPCPSAS